VADPAVAREITGIQAVPFVDIGNQYLVPQAQHLPSALANLSWAQVAAEMRNPSSLSARTSTARPT